MAPITGENRDSSPIAIIALSPERREEPPGVVVAHCGSWFIKMSHAFGGTNSSKVRPYHASLASHTFGESPTQRNPRFSQKHESEVASTFRISKSH